MVMHSKDLKDNDSLLINGSNFKTQSIVSLTQVNQAEWLIKISKE